MHEFSSRGSEMASGMSRTFEIPLFDGKINFTLWQSTIQDLLVQQSIDQALEDEKPGSMSDRMEQNPEEGGEYNQVGTCSRDQVQRVEGVHAEVVVGEAREHLSVEVADEPIVFEDGVVLTEDG